MKTAATFRYLCALVQNSPSLEGDGVGIQVALNEGQSVGLSGGQLGGGKLLRRGTRAYYAQNVGWLLIISGWAGRASFVHKKVVLMSAMIQVPLLSYHFPANFSG